MRFNSKSIIIAGSIAALSLGMVACHGQSPGDSAYVPTSTAALPASGLGSAIQPAGKKRDIDIHSSCSHRLHIVLLGIVDCRFLERKYQNGIFSVTDEEKGIVSVYPSQGTHSTVFTITGLVLGSGHLVWKDTKGNQYKIGVKVTL
jgi:hypothetical protein